MNYELNITLQCQGRCANCNRLCNLYPDRTDHVSIEQISDFVKGCKAVKGGIGKVKILGGEPLLHPQFKQIIELLLDGVKSKAIRYLKIDSNGIIPMPEYVKNRPEIRLMGKRFSRKVHVWIANPEDFGITTTAQPKCQMLKRCGISLDNRGYLPCSSAIMIVRLFNLQHLYRKEFQTQPWGLDEICPKCQFSLPMSWQTAHQFNIRNTPKEYQLPSKSIMDKINGNT